jgi:hypothetical protein
MKPETIAPIAVIKHLFICTAYQSTPPTPHRVANLVLESRNVRGPPEISDTVLYVVSSIHPSSHGAQGEDPALSGLLVRAKSSPPPAGYVGGPPTRLTPMTSANSQTVIPEPSHSRPCYSRARGRSFLPKSSLLLRQSDQIFPHGSPALHRAEVKRPSRVRQEASCP